MRILLLLLYLLLVVLCTYGYSAEIRRKREAELKVESLRNESLLQKHGRSPIVEEMNYDSDELERICADYGVKPDNVRHRVWDAFMFFNEFEMLEVRLFELYPVVHRFVLVEATRTHSNVEKRLYFAENAERYLEYLDKIIYVVVDSLPQEMPEDGTTQLHWKREASHRNEILRGLTSVGSDDVIMVSDCDEIPYREVVEGLEYCNFGLNANVSLEMHSVMFYYNLQWLWFEDDGLPSMWEFGPKAATLSWIMNESPTRLRHKRGPGERTVVLRNVAWHFSYFGGLETIKAKIAAYAHQENHKPDIVVDSHILKSVTQGKDLFSRKSMNGMHQQTLSSSGIKWDSDNDMWISEYCKLPAALMAKPEKYKHWAPNDNSNN